MSVELLSSIMLLMAWAGLIISGLAESYFRAKHKVRGDDGRPLR